MSDSSISFLIIILIICEQMRYEFEMLDFFNQDSELLFFLRVDKCELVAYQAI